MNLLPLFLLFFNARTVEAVRVEHPPVIDGVLDEACWLQSPGITDFMEQYPELCQEPSESTRVVVCYDDKFIYFGCFCYDSEPDKVLARLVPRESSGDGDDLTISIDTYDDDRNAFRFSINPLGIQRDVHITNGGHGYDIAWNGVWYSEATIEKHGWFAEIAIPFKTLRFAPGEEQVWGLSVSRWMNEKYERVIWSDYEPSDQGQGTLIHRFGELTGIRGVKPGLHMEFLPHLTQTARFQAPELLDTVSFVPFQNGVAGLDIKWVMLSNLTLDVTTFPDYGQIEADPERINLGRYESYLSERRPFFTEGADLFNLGYFDPVYTRRIGAKLADGSEVPIWGGAKFTGKIAGTEVGIIEVYTDEARYDYYGTETIEPRSLYSIARVSQDLFARSKVGVIATSREQFGTIHQGDRVLGGDIDLSITDDWYVNGEGLYSFHSDPAQQGGPMGILGFGKSGRFNFHTSVSYTDSLADLSAVGYLNRSGHTWANANVGYNDSWGQGVLRSLYVNMGPSMGKNLEDTLMSYNSWMSIGGSFSNNWHTNVNGSFARSYYQEDSTLRWAKGFGGGSSSDGTKDLSGGLWFNVHDQYIYDYPVPLYFGHVATVSPNASWRPVHNVVLSAYGTMFFTYQESWELDPDDPFRWTAGQSLRYTATRRLSFRLNLQQNTDTQSYTQQLLTTWEIAPLSYCYLASSVNLTGDPATASPFDLEVSDVTLYAKIVYLFRI